MRWVNFNVLAELGSLALAIAACGPARTPEPERPPLLGISSGDPTVSVRPDGTGNGACWIDGRRRSLDLSLYVSGFNHGGTCRNGIASHEGVEQAGLDQFIDFIVDPAMTPDPDGLLIALTGNMICDCDAGPWTSSQPPHHADCLRFRLENRLSRPFTVGHWDLWDIGGNAIITGPRWEHVGIDYATVQTPAGPFRYLEVTLRDTRRDRGAPGSEFQVAVVHTADNAAAQPQIEAVAARLALQHRRTPDQLPPLIVGDFNSPNCGRPECAAPAWETANASGLQGILRDEFVWADNELSGCGLRLENDIVHVLVGKGGGRYNFGCAPATFERVRVGYVTDGAGQPYYPREGVLFSEHIRHNVVALGFEIVPRSPPECAGGRCEGGECVVECTCQSPQAVGSACGGQDACGNTCACVPGSQCENGACTSQTYDCVSDTNPDDSVACLAGAQRCCRADFAHCCPRSRACTRDGCR
jgi:hypothetical protein